MPNAPTDVTTAAIHLQALHELALAEAKHMPGDGAGEGEGGSDTKDRITALLAAMKPLIETVTITLLEQPSAQCAHG